MKTFKEKKAGNFIVFHLYDWYVKEIEGYKDMTITLLNYIEKDLEEEFAEELIEQLQDILEVE